MNDRITESVGTEQPLLGIAGFGQTSVNSRTRFFISIVSGSRPVAPDRQKKTPARSAGRALVLQSTDDLRKQRANSLRLDQLAWLVEVVVDDCFRMNTN